MTEMLWSWWVGSSDERFHTECSSHEEAVRIAKEEYEGAYIVEAAKPSNIMLSEYFDAEQFMEEADDRAYDDHGDPEGVYDDIFAITMTQRDDLEAKVRSAISAWQDEHKLVFTGFRFSASRNMEYISPKPESEAHQ